MTNTMTCTLLSTITTPRNQLHYPSASPVLVSRQPVQALCCVATRGRPAAAAEAWCLVAPPSSQGELANVSCLREGRCYPSFWKTAFALCFFWGRLLIHNYMHITLKYSSQWLLSLVVLRILKVILLYAILVFFSKASHM